ncbi:MAG: NADH-quinone oxidoreductase subunit N [candidate division Zixibacteria bacterium]|nr:NADH-quinone oxidoreductase subunit N [candidate division Zixibacteria bacterium]
MEFSFPDIDFSLLMPSFVVAGTAFLTMLLVPFLRRRHHDLVAHLSWIGLVVAMYLTGRLIGSDSATFGTMFLADSFSHFFNGIFLMASILTVFMSMDYLKKKEIDYGEFYPLVLFATFGMMVMASSANLVIIFLGLEIMSMALYVLAGLARRQLRSTEAAIKYFLLGAFASGFTVFGIAFVYGATGSFDMLVIAGMLSGSISPYLLIGGALIIVGLGFKVAAVPFHMWAPDVYEGAPSPVTGFMSVGPKAAAFAALLRIFSFGFAGLHGDLETLFWILAVATMTIGNIMALRQGNIKRMLAFSSIAHAGYIMIALVVGGSETASAAALYLLCYAVTNLGAFMIITLVDSSSGTKDRTSLDSYAGLARLNPIVGVVLTLFLISLAGFPPTAGFIAKFVLFKAALAQGFYIIVVIAVLNSLVSVYYYLRVVVKMFMHEPAEQAKALPLPAPLLMTALIFAVIALFALGIYPQGWFPFDGLTLYALN